MVRLAIIGLGNIGKVHLDKYRHLKDQYQLELFFSKTNTNKIDHVYRDMIKNHGKCLAHGYSDYKRLLKDVRPYLVDICSPDEFHAEHIEYALESRAKAIICEKPLFHPKDIKKGRELVEKAERNGILLATNLTMIAMKNQLQHVNGKDYREIEKLKPYRMVWMTKKDNGSQPDIDLLPHALSLCDINTDEAKKSVYNNGKLITINSANEEKEIVIGYVDDADKKIRKWSFNEYVFEYGNYADGHVQINCNALKDPIMVKDPMMVSLEAFLQEDPIADGKAGLENAEKVARLHNMH